MVFVMYYSLRCREAANVIFNPSVGCYLGELAEWSNAAVLKTAVR